MKISPDTATRLIDVRELAKRFDTSTRTIYRMLQRGQLPPPVRLSRGTVRWRLSDVIEFVETLNN